MKFKKKGRQENNQMKGTEDVLSFQFMKTLNKFCKMDVFTKIISTFFGLSYDSITNEPYLDNFPKEKKKEKNLLYFL